MGCPQFDEEGPNFGAFLIGAPADLRRRAGGGWDANVKRRSARPKLVEQSPCAFCGDEVSLLLI
jgi:hypothetical protein